MIIKILVGVCVTLAGFVGWFLNKLGRDKQIKKELEDAVNEAIEAKKVGLKNASDSASAVRKRLLSRARDE